MWDGFVSWARRSAIRLPDPLDATPELTAWMGEALAGKRILFVGEADHWIHEKVDYRLAFARAALPAGFDWFGEELGWSDGLRIDRYLKGETDSLDDITLFGHRGELRPDRDDSPTGILRASYERPADALFRAEHERLLAGLRACRRSAPALRFFGFDVDGLPGGAYADVARLAGGDVAEAIRRVPGESLAEEVDRLDRALDSLSDMDSLARTSLRTLRDSLHYTSLAHPAPSYDALAPAMAYRERVMHRHVDLMIDRLPRDHGLVLWAHDFHLARDDAGIVAPGGVGPGGDSEHSVGHHVCAEHGDDVLVVWMVCGGGESAHPLPDLPRRLRPGRRSLNAVLERVGGNFLLPTHSAESAARKLAGVQRFHHLYDSFADVRIREQADAICFIEEVTPLRADC